MAAAPDRFPTVLPPPASQTVGFTTVGGFEFVQRVAKMLSASNLVPKDYQNNVPNVAIALNMASRIGADPLQVMQSLVIVHGRPTWSAQFLIACFNQCGRYTSIRYRFTGEPGKDSHGCVAYAKEISTGDTVESSEITIGLAKAEGWYSRSGSKWQSIPSHMLMLRAAAWLVRTHAPELAMGLTTREEALDVIDLQRTPEGTFATPEPAPGPDAIMASLTPVEPDQGRGPGQPEPPPAKPKKPSHPEPTLAEITEKINAAKTLDELNAVALASKWLPVDDLPPTRELWAMKAELLRNSAAVDTETGEVAG